MTFYFKRNVQNNGSFRERADLPAGAWINLNVLADDSPIVRLFVFSLGLCALGN